MADMAWARQGVIDEYSDQEGLDERVLMELVGRGRVSYTEQQIISLVAGSPMAPRTTMPLEDQLRLLGQLSSEHVKRMRQRAPAFPLPINSLLARLGRIFVPSFNMGLFTLKQRTLSHWGLVRYLVAVRSFVLRWQLQRSYRLGAPGGPDHRVVLEDAVSLGGTVTDPANLSDVVTLNAHSPTGELSAIAPMRGACARWNWRHWRDIMWFKGAKLHLPTVRRKVERRGIDHVIDLLGDPESCLFDLHDPCRDAPHALWEADDPFDDLPDDLPYYSDEDLPPPTVHTDPSDMTDVD